jgi:hypothetical protein
VVEDIMPFLDAWQANRSLSAGLQLADLLDTHWTDLANGGHLPGPWRHARGREVIERWLADPGRAQTLQDIFERYVDDARAARLAVAVDSWQWMTSGLR